MAPRKSVCVFSLMLMAAGAASCSKSSGSSCGNPANYKVTIDPAKFAYSTNVTNKYFSLTPGTVKRSKDTDGSITDLTVTPDTKTVMGVQCVVVHDAVTSSTGELLEDTYDWFAQDTDGNVWYFGEDTKAYTAGQPGVVASTKGSWQAGVNCALPGIAMEANPKVGDIYRQEYLAGTAEDQAEILAVGETVTVPYSTFNNCVKTRDFTKLEPGQDENKWFCAGVGEVKAVDVAVGGGSEELMTMSKGGKPVGCANTSPGPGVLPMNPADFPSSTKIDNKYLSYVPGTVHKSVDADGSVIEVTVTSDTKVIMGVTCMVVHDTQKTSDGVLVEDTYDWFAQDKLGNVWYFGEDTKTFNPQGDVVSAIGTWTAGVDCAVPGLVMSGTPTVNDSFSKGWQSGVEEDMFDILALNEPRTVPYGTFIDCVKMKDYSGLEPGQAEWKWFCAGVGEVEAYDLSTGTSEKLVAVNGQTSAPDAGAPADAPTLLDSPAPADGPAPTDGPTPADGGMD